MTVLRKSLLYLLLSSTISMSNPVDPINIIDNFETRVARGSKPNQGKICERGQNAVTPVEIEAAAVTQAFAGYRREDCAKQMTKQMTITLQNNYGSEIKTRHDKGPGVPAPSGNPSLGSIAEGEAATIVFPRGWHGNIAINDARYPVDTGDESLIEGSFVDQGRGNVGDIDVSYVNGFSVPIVCQCNENEIYTGCSKNLWEYNVCPNDNGKHSCRNDARHQGWNGTPHIFFTPCRGPGGAYTFPADDEANNLNARCPKEQYTCCVGKYCTPNPSQERFS